MKKHYCEPAVEPRRSRPRSYSGLSLLLLAVVAVTLRTFKGADLTSSGFEPEEATLKPGKAVPWNG